MSKKPISPISSSEQLLELQLNQISNSDSSRYPDQGNGPNGQRPLPASGNDAVFEWRRKAEIAEAKVKFLEEKIKSVAIAVKADRDKQKQIISDLKERAEASEEKASKLEKKLSELVEHVKAEKSRVSSLKSSSSPMIQQFMAEQSASKQAQEYEAQIIELKDSLEKSQQLNEHYKSQVEYLQAQLDESRDQLSRQSSNYQPGSMVINGQHKPKPRRNKLVGLYNYPGEKSDDLQFTEGEILTLLKKYSNGWWLAEKNGRVGRVPSNFVEELELSKRVAAQALGTFTADKKGDLSFKEGDVLLVFKTAEEWWVGELNGKVGWVPSNFFEEVSAVTQP